MSQSPFWSSSVVLSAALAVALLGCDDVPFRPAGNVGPGAPTGELPSDPNVCDVSAYVFDLSCVGCHGAGGQSPDLRADAVLASLVDVESATYPGRALVVAGDAEASLLFRKVHGPAADEGARMPFGDTLDVELVDLVRTWIDGGAKTDCTPGSAGSGGSGGGGGNGGIAPGGDIDVGPPPTGYASTPPFFAEGANCSTGQWWQHAGDEEEAFTMHPGHACITCHSASDDEDAPSFAFAGTVMNDLRDEDDCRGVPGVRVELLDINDVVFASATTNAAGNFGLTSPRFQEFRVRLTLDGRAREMATHQDTGDCMSCHTASGRNGAPGRIVAP